MHSLGLRVRRGKHRPGEPAAKIAGALPRALGIQPPRTRQVPEERETKPARAPSRRVAMNEFLAERFDSPHPLFQLVPALFLRAAWPANPPVSGRTRRVPG